MRFTIRPIRVTGYHGTTRPRSANILEEGFTISQKPWEWLGHGVYFWQDAPYRAHAWARDWTRQRGIEGEPVVVAAELQLESYLDFLDVANTDILRPLAIKFLETLGEGAVALKNKYPNHRLDCRFFNFVSEVLESGDDRSGP